MGNQNWICYVRDRNKDRVGQVDDYTELKAKLVFNDVGEWSMSIDRSSLMLVPLTTPGYGIELVNKDTMQTFFSGLVDEREQVYNAATDTLKLTGWDDNIYLAFRVSSPSPTEQQPPYSVAAFDVRSGVCSTVLRAYVNANLGPGAVSSRVEPNFTIGTDPAVGGTVNGRLRWTPLLADIQSLAKVGGDIGFRCKQVGTNIEFQTFQPIDRTEDIKFSVKLGNLIGGNIKTTSPKATFCYVGGDGDGTARKIVQDQDGAFYTTWGRREVFVDQSSTNVDAELQQKIVETFADQGEKAEFGIQILDTAVQQYGVDYNLGDKVTAIFVGNEPTPDFEGGQVQEIIREVSLTLTDEEQRITPVVGTPSRYDVFRIFREIRRIRTRLGNLENH